MKDKKSFILYTDLIHTVSKLPDENAGKLFKIILEYVNDLNPTVDDLIVDVVFEPIKQQLKRDLQKYSTYIDKQKANGLKGGRPKTQKTQAFILKPKKADSVNDNVNDSVIKRFVKPTPKDVLHYMTEKGFPNQADRFVDFYEAKGWMIGKNKMKDWKSCVRNWNRKDTSTNNQPKIML